MNLFESISFYASSILIIWISYFISIILYKNLIFHSIGRPFFHFIVIFPVAFVASIRDINTGTDTYNVVMSYHRVSNMSFGDVIAYDNTGFTFNILRKIIGAITNQNEVVYLFIITYLVIFFVLKAIEIWNLKDGTLALWIFYTCFGPILFDQIRQLIAVSIVLYAYWYAVKKCTRKYFLWILFAGTFHLSALFVGTIVYLIQFKENSALKEKVYIIAIVVATVSLKYILSFVSAFFSSNKYGIYFEDTKNTMSIGFGLLLTLIPSLIPAFILRNKMDEKHNFFNMNLMILPSRVAGYISFFISRIVYYFSVVNVIAFPLAIEKCSDEHEKRNMKIIVYVCCTTYFVLYYWWLMADVYFPYHTTFK